MTLKGSYFFLQAYLCSTVWIRCILSVGGLEINISIGGFIQRSGSIYKLMEVFAFLIIMLHKGAQINNLDKKN